MVVYGFHPVRQQSNIGAALDKLMIDQQWREVYRYAFQGLEPPERIRIAWRSVLPEALFLFQKPMRLVFCSLHDFYTHVAAIWG